MPTYLAIKELAEENMNYSVKELCKLGSIYKTKKLLILFGTVCILNTMAIGCGSATESAVKTEEAWAGEILPPLLTRISLEKFEGWKRIHFSL